MSTSHLIRWSGLAGVLGGVLFALYFVMYPVEEDVATILNRSAWVVAAHTSGMAAMVLTLLGLVGLYARQAEKAGWLGLIGFLLAFLGTAQLLIANFFGYLAPVFAAHAPALLDEAGPLVTSGPILGFILLMMVSFVLGFILFGIATVRAGVLPRWGGWLLTIGAPLWTLVQLLSHIGGIFAAQVFVFGLVWLGYALWSGKGETVRHPVSVGGI